MAVFELIVLVLSAVRTPQSARQDRCRNGVGRSRCAGLTVIMELMRRMSSNSDCGSIGNFPSSSCMTGIAAMRQLHEKNESWPCPMTATDRVCAETRPQSNGQIHGRWSVHRLAVADTAGWIQASSRQPMLFKASRQLTLLRWYKEEFGHLNWSTFVCGEPSIETSINILSQWRGSAAHIA